jgi:hypothetical protein
MDETNEKTSQPRVPSDIRVYLRVLAITAVTLLVLWLAFRFI